MDQFNQFDQTSQPGEPRPLSPSPLPPSPLLPSPPLPRPTSTFEMLALPPEVTYPTRETLYEAIQS